MFIRNRVISLFGVILFGAALVVSANAYSPAPAPPVYSAVGDFPTVVTGVTSATNLPWSYGYASTLNPVNFTPDTNATSDYFGDGNAVGFIRRP